MEISANIPVSFSLPGLCKNILIPHRQQKFMKSQPQNSPFSFAYLLKKTYMVSIFINVY